MESAVDVGHAAVVALLTLGTSHANDDGLFSDSSGETKANGLTAGTTMMRDQQAPRRAESDRELTERRQPIVIFSKSPR
jgi:hypothetical protein